MTTVSPGVVSSQFPPTSAFMSTITDPLLKERTADSGIVMGAGLPKILAVVTITSASLATSHTVSFTFWINSGVRGLAYPDSSSKSSIPSTSMNLPPTDSICSAADFLTSDA